MSMYQLIHLHFLKTPTHCGFEYTSLYIVVVHIKILPVEPGSPVGELVEELVVRSGERAAE